MKQALFAIILTPISLLGIVYGQIPNGGFEDWEFIQNFEKPVGWNTNQDSNLIRFEKDTLSVEGSYSLKFVPSTYTAFYNCTSFAYKRIGLDGPIGENKSLTFFLRSVPDTLNPFESAYFEIKCAFFESGTLSSHYEWTTFEVIDDFIKIEIPIANSSVEKVKPLQKVLLSVESLWPLLKMAEDLKSISIHQYKLYTDLLVEIGSQAQSWLKWAKIKK